MQVTWSGVCGAMIGLAVLLLVGGCSATAESGPASPPAAESAGASPSPVASPRPAPPANQRVFVTNTDRLGADYKRTPGPTGEQIRVLPEGAVVEATGQAQQVDNQTWFEVRDTPGDTSSRGWVMADFISITPPPLATPTPMAFMPTPTPLQTLVPIALPTQPTAGPRPTDTLVPIGPPRQQPGLAPLPAAPATREAPPTLPPPAQVRPTDDVIDGSTDRIRCPDGTFVEPNRPGGCEGRGTPRR